MSFGKYAGTALADVPEDYLNWLIDTKKKEIDGYQDELDHRARAEEASMSMVDRIAQEGFKAMAKKLHPDKGGSTSEFQNLTASFEHLKEILTEVKRVTGA